MRGQRGEKNTAQPAVGPKTCRVKVQHEKNRFTGQTGEKKSRKCKTNQGNKERNDGRTRAPERMSRQPVPSGGAQAGARARMAAEPRGQQRKSAERQRNTKSTWQKKMPTEKRQPAGCRSAGGGTCGADGDTPTAESRKGYRQYGEGGHITAEVGGGAALERPMAMQARTREKEAQTVRARAGEQTSASQRRNTRAHAVHRRNRYGGQDPESANKRERKRKCHDGQKKDRCVRSLRASGYTVWLPPREGERRRRQ